MDASVKASVQQAGKDFLTPLKRGCYACSVRRRGTYGWVFEPCGLCDKGSREVPSANQRWTVHVAESDWYALPNWGSTYLAGDVIPAPWAVFIPRGWKPQHVSVAPAYVARLLFLGAHLRKRLRKLGGSAVSWPRVFALIAENEELRRALDATLMSVAPGMTILHTEVAPFAAEAAHTFFCEHAHSVFVLDRNQGAPGE